MIVISPPLVSVFVTTIPISIYFTRFMSKKVRPLFRDRNEKLGELVDDPDSVEGLEQVAEESLGYVDPDTIVIDPNP